ncbi:O-antigen ligase family protein [Sporosarcina sp. FA15]|uniref:O-antigen ligase family protein n=1 Tax=Sporosarcina sp. FA15 TaxID=3413031 RepID=UPI003F656D9F
MLSVVGLQSKRRNNENDLKSQLFGKGINYRMLLLFSAIELIFYISLDNPLFGYFGALILIISCFFLNSEHLIYLVVFLLANQRIIVFPQSDVTLINIIIVIALIKVLLLYKKQIVIPDIIIFLVFILYSLFTVFLSGSISNVFIGLKSTLLFITLLYIFKQNTNNINWYYNLVMYFSIGCIISGTFGFIINGGSMFGENIRFDPGGDNNSNIFGTMLSFAIANLLVITLLNKKFSLTVSIFIMLLLTFGFMTQSRSFMLATSITFLYIVIVSLTNNKLNKKYLYATIFIILCTMVYMILNQDTILSKIFNSTMDRIINPRGDDISGGRLEIWTNYLDILFSNNTYLFWGMGDYKSYGLTVVAHNAFIEVVVSWGVIGLLIIISLFIYVWYNLSRIWLNKGHIKNGLVAYAPLVVVIITSMTGHSLLGIGVIVQIFISIQALYGNKLNTV